MQILYWSLSLLTLFNVQYSYDISKVPIDNDHVSIINGTLRTCIYPKDRTFKKGSPTFPRSELRLLEEQVDGTYNASVEVKSVEAVAGMDYSVWQLFGNGPMVMNRVRFGKKQVVVFQGTPKFTQVDEFPNWCTIKCGPSGFVVCPGVQSFGEIDCGDSLHLKVGIYAQQMKPKAVTCSEYGVISLDTVAYGDSITP